MIIVLLGPPGAGKGTQGDRMSSLLQIPRVSTGDLLRDATRAGTKLGLEAKAYMDRGDLVPDDVILGIVREAFASERTRAGALLDGVVRTVPQAQGLQAALAELGRGVDAVLVFDVADNELVKRLGGRTVCDSCSTPYTGREPGSKCEKCGGTLVRRKDDESDAIRNRLKVYRAQTAPVIDWYKKHGGGTKLLKIDASGSLDEVTSRAMDAISKNR